MIKILFGNGLYLWYLLSIPILIFSHFFFLKRARYKSLRFSNFNTIKRLTGAGYDKLLTKNWLILILRLIILLSVILAISAPVLWYTTIAQDKDFVIAIDSSASMLAKDFEPNRLGAAKLEAINFVKKVAGNPKIGVVDFAGNTFIDQVPVDDKNKVITVIEELEPMPLGGTDLAGAVISSTNLLMFSERGRIVIMISDGSNTVDAYNMRALNSAINYAAGKQVIVNTIGIGSNTGPIGYLPEYYNITAVYTPEQLKYIANNTEGKFYDGNNLTSLTAAFEEILNEKQESFTSKDIKPILLLIGLLALFLEWGLINTRFKRLP
jgi:Ca-activated chloride channel homolog